MGVSHFVMALDDETADWLAENGTQRPSPLPESRLPSLREVKAAVGHLEGHVVQVRDAGAVHAVDIDVADDRDPRGRCTTIWTKRADEVPEQPGDDDSVRLTFHKGHPELAVLVVERLTHVCGPLVLVRDVDACPLLVEKGTDPRQAVEGWATEE